MNALPEWVFNWIKPKEFQGMPAHIHKPALETWILRYQDEVRRGINDKRNNIQQEMPKVIRKKLAENKEEVLFWEPEEVWNLILRKNLTGTSAEAQANRAKYDFFVDEVVPKFATSEAWGPNYRHTTIMMEAQQTLPEDQVPLMCVPPSDLAYIYSYFQIYGGQLHWEVRKHNNELTVFPDTFQVVAARGHQSYGKTKEDGTTETIYHENKPPLPPLYACEKGGRKPFGGWLFPSIKIYKQKRAELKKIYAAGPRNADYKRVKKADEECLERLRVLHKRDRTEEKRATRKKGKPKAPDEEEDEGDFSD